MNMLRRCALVAAAAAALLPASCSSTPMPADGVADGDDLSGLREIFADDLRGEVEVERPSLRRTEQNLLKVNVPLRNVSGDDLELLVQVQFLDDLGAPSGDETNRQYLRLPRGSTTNFGATSRTSSAHDYKLYLWRADR